MRAALFGMSEATSPGNIAQAGLEAVAFQIRAILDSLQSGPHASLSTIKVDGGLTRSRYFLELQAILLGQPLLSGQSDSVTPFGAALMAGLGAGVWPTIDTLRGLIPEAGRIDPDPRSSQALENRYREWRQAIDMMLTRQRA